MGKAQASPPPMQQNASTLSIPPPPAPSLKIPKVADREHSDPEFEKVLDQVRTRQWASIEKAESLSPGDMAFGMMRNLPRKDWNTPLTKLGHWPRGSSIAEIKANPELRDFTPAQAMTKLFEMDDELKKGKK